jgi:putative flavoprotein involved in K+ transport
MSVVVIGAGPAGLSVSQQLTVLGVDHVVLERATVAQAWRDRWVSFTLVTPIWTLDLPGDPYVGPDPEGHVHRDEIVAYLEKYAAAWLLPIREGVQVQPWLLMHECLRYQACQIWLCQLTGVAVGGCGESAM